MERVDRQQLLSHLKSMQEAFLTSVRHTHPAGTPLTPPLSLQLKDLRSAITRETCVTLAFIATILGVEFASVAETMMTQLIPLLSNSAKVSGWTIDIGIGQWLDH